MKSEQRNKAMKESISKNEHDNIVHRLKCKLQVMERKFNIEKNAKNEVYAFILSCGHLEEYIAFHKKNIGEDHYAMGIEAIINEASHRLNHSMSLENQNITK